MALRGIVLSATAWSAAEVILRQAVQFAISVLLARLLTPRDFGVVAMMQVFVSIATAFASCGLGWALIQSQDVTAEDESTVFWLNLLTGTLMAGLLWLAGPWIAAFYGVPILEPLSTIMGIAILAAAAGDIQQTLLSKELNFRPMLLASATAVVISGSVAVWLAWSGFGVWALAIQILLSSIVTSSVLWFASSWRPKFSFNISSARKLYGFGGFMLLSGIIDILYLRLYAVVGGKMYNPSEVGLYSRAEVISAMPSGIIVGIFGRVTFPLFSRVSKDVEALRDSVKAALKNVMLIHAPMSLGLAAVSEPMVLVVFGESWRGSYPFLQVLSLGGLFLPVHVLNHHALLSLGKAKLFFHVDLVKKIAGIIIILLAAPFGLLAIAWATLVANIIFLIINCRISRKAINLGLLDQIKCVAPVFLLSTAMAATVAFVDGIQVGWSPVTRLFVGILIGMLTYGGGVLVINPNSVVTAARAFFSASEKRSA